MGMFAITRERWIAVLVGVLLTGICASQSLMDFAALLLAIAGLKAVITMLQEGHHLLSPLKMLFAVWLMIIAAGLWIVAPPEALRWTNLLEFRWMLELFMWMALFSTLPITDRNWPWLLTGVLISCAYGLFAFVLGVSPVHGFEPVSRVGGLLGNPMPFAHAIGPLSVFAFGYVLQQQTAFEEKFPIILLLILCLTTLLTFTRGVWLGVAVAGLALPILSRRKHGWALSALIVVAGLALVMIAPPLRERLTQVFDSTRSYDSERFNLWRTNWLMFSDSPWIGIGYGENHRRLPEYFVRLGIPSDHFQGHAHNQYIQFLAGTGILGLCCYLIFCLIFLRWSWQISRSQNRRTAGFGLGLFGAQIAFHVAALTESNFSIAKNRYLLLLFMATTFALRGLGMNSNKESHPAESAPSAQGEGEAR